MDFSHIPNTQLEIASSGSGNNRIIFFRLEGDVEPILPLEITRIVMIGYPEKYILEAMDAGFISRPKLSNLIPTISGNTYERLRKHLMQSEVAEVQ